MWPASEWLYTTGVWACDVHVQLHQAWNSTKPPYTCIGPDSLMPGLIPGLMPGFMPGLLPGLLPGLIPGLMPGLMPGPYGHTLLGPWGRHVVVCLMSCRGPACPGVYVFSRR